MKKNEQRTETGSAIICALCTILIISLIGGNVLLNCTTRYNVTSKQVKGWKEALCAAEAGGDIAYAETRKVVSNSGTEFTGAGWTSSNQANGPWAYTMPNPIGPTDSATGTGSLTATVQVDRFQSIAGNALYRIRSIGTARVFGLRRGGMDDSMTRSGTNFKAGASSRGNGDSLLRKIDFNYDHFKATYGDGDGTNLQQVAVPKDSNGNSIAQVSRRVELISVPAFSVSAAIKTSGSFYGPGASGAVDSFDSKNGKYDQNVAPSSSPHPAFYSDSHDGNIADGSSSFDNQNTGMIYGNVSTYGATLKKQAVKYITGAIDNTVPQVVAPQPRVTPPSDRSYEAQTQTITPPLSNPKVSGQNPDSWENAPWYHYTYLKDVTINPVTVTDPATNKPIARETYINIVVDGTSGTTSIKDSLTINQGANVRIYFTGNVDIQVKNFTNNNQDNLPQPNITPAVVANGTPSTNYSASAHVQFYGVTPPTGVTQTVNLDPNGKPGIEAFWYVPGADFISANGNIDMYGAIVAKTFHANGTTTFHFDKQLATDTKPIDYRIASYIEDVR